MYMCIHVYTYMCLAKVLLYVHVRANITEAFLERMVL